MEPPGQPSIYRDPRRGAQASARASETWRQGERLVLFLPVFLLPFLPHWAPIPLGTAIALYLAFGSARLLPRSLRADEVGTVVPTGKLAHGGMVLLLLVLFRHKLFVAAGAWAVMAVGDGAANLLGRAVGSVRLPWNRGKSLVGSLACLGLGSAAAFLAIQWVNFPPTPFGWDYSLRLALFSGLIGTVVESLPLPVDDDIPVACAVGAFLAVYTHGFLMQVNRVLI